MGQEPFTQTGNSQHMVYNGGANFGKRGKQARDGLNSTEKFGISAISGPGGIQEYRETFGQTQRSQSNRAGSVTGRSQNMRVSFQFDPNDPNASRNDLNASTNSGRLKNSMKYSKPACLQNQQPRILGGSFLGRTNQSLLNATSNTVGGLPIEDHNDNKLKLKALSKKFLDVNKEKNPFKDTFLDEEIFNEILASKNYFKLSLELLKYTLHSGNNRTKVSKKNPRSASAGLALSNMFSSRF